MNLETGPLPVSAKSLEAGPATVVVAGLGALFDALPCAVAVIGCDGRVRYANRGFVALVGWSASELIGRTLAEVLGKAGAEAIEPQGLRALHGETVTLEDWVVARSGERRLMRRVFFPLPAGVCGGASDPSFGLMEEDATTLHQVDLALQTSEAIKTAALNTTRDAVVTIDVQGVIIDFNPAAALLLGVSRDKALGQLAADLLVPPEMRQAHSRGLKRYLGQGRPRVLGRRVEVEAMRADGTRVPVEMTVVEVRVGERRLFTANLRDISERRDSEVQQIALAYHDPVTGLPNRLKIMRILGDGLGLGARAPLLLINIHIDRFSSIRNSFGHAFADDLMIGLAGRLASGIAPTDQLGRIGENALALVVFGRRDDPVVMARLSAITESLHSVVTPSGASVFLSASLGAVEATAQHETSDDLLRDAEIATSRAREAGVLRLVWFEPSMHARVIDQVRTEHDLRRALDLGIGLWVAYQPIVELVSERVAGFEALVRWHHPERGQIPPVEFIPVAEETGLVVMLGRWVLTEACRQLACWQATRHSAMPDLFMSVNLSPRQLEEPGFADTVRAVIAETGIDPAWLKLELTESAVMRRPEDSIVVLRELKGLGVQLSIDDFGTGYSSLSYLHKFPLDSIKIDRSFVSALHLSDENRSIVRIIVDLARLLGFDVIAEGIESDKDANLLRALACDFGQGYYYARPQAPDQVGALLHGRPPWMQAGPGSARG